MQLVQNLRCGRLFIFVAAFMFPVILISCDGNEVMNVKKIDTNEIINGYNIIFHRINQDDYDTVNALLDAGVDINIRGFNGMTPAFWAAGGGNWIMVEMLANRGADLSIKDKSGHSVADSAEGADKLQRVRPGSANEKSFENVKQMLRERGLY